uniref:Conserved hypothethical protein n=1 Tax=blood disease bacterium R229 TaxID=741978 RepID=G2ZUR3_9RALS|nr:conserved hypothethical protein [blood disease bacterium R229]
MVTPGACALAGNGRCGPLEAFGYGVAATVGAGSRGNWRRGNGIEPTYTALQAAALTTLPPRQGRDRPAPVRCSVGRPRF